MEQQLSEIELQQKELLELRAEAGLNRKEFAIEYEIPLRTVEDWEHGKRKMPPYLLRLLSYKVKMDVFCKTKEEKVLDTSKNVSIICDADGKKVVLINDIRFKSRRSIDWNDIEKFLREYIGKCYEIVESSERVYIGADFPGEFAYSIDTKSMKGANEKAKANMISAVGELIQIATNRKGYPDYGKKHKAKAKYGWFRYDSRFGIPVYSEEGELLRYNIFSTRMLIRCDADGKMYLYDFVRTKKETSRPPKQ